MKTCANCHRTHSRASWLTLRYLGIQNGDGGDDLELRSCHCKSTLAVAVTADEDEDVFDPLRRAVGG